MIEGLSHITFVVRDLDRMAAFLTAIFDAEEVYASGALCIFTTMTTTCSSCMQGISKIGWPLTVGSLLPAMPEAVLRTRPD